MSVLTPVYNGEPYLAECIESVLAQTYTNWEYTIVDNQSTDATPEIARKYAAQSSRIRVIRNDRFLPIIENHNAAMRELSREATYCKVLFADDWMYPACLEKMVALAQRCPGVGIVGAYGTDGREVLWKGLAHGGDAPTESECIPGKDVSRKTLMGEFYVFGSSSSLLFRADLVRKRPMFFNEQNMHADLEVCYELLQESDFGFVHDVLTFRRLQEESQTEASSEMNSFILGDYVALLKFGPVFLTPDELRRRGAEVKQAYHRTMARNVLRLRPSSFWKYHEETLAGFGAQLDRKLLATELMRDVIGMAPRPRQALAGAVRWWTRRVKGVRKVRNT